MNLNVGKSSTLILTSHQSGLKTSMKNLTTGNIKVDDQQIINQSLFEVGSPQLEKEEFQTSTILVTPRIMFVQTTSHK